MASSKPPKRNDNRIIIHFDYDCFYASVFENENPALKTVPLAVQQKQIVVTCNYEARRRGMKKLMLIHEAKKIVPDVVIVLGEELGRFRDASKILYKFLEAFTWSGKVERLGFDEVFMDVSDIIDFNQSLLNPNDLTNSFFQLKRDDPTIGFPFDATQIAGHVYPKNTALPPPLSTSVEEETLLTRLLLGSHLAQHIRWALEEEKGYTSTVGISTNKLISKLAGNLNKPKGQTTILPPYEGQQSNVTVFIDSHELRKIPGIGFKISQRIREHVFSSRQAQASVSPSKETDPSTKDPDSESTPKTESSSLTIHEVRLFPSMGPELLEQLLSGPGSSRGIGGKIWGLINGVDETEVSQAKKIPTQISIEDSYTKLDTLPLVYKELRILATSLLKRMHTDLLEDIDEETPPPNPNPNSEPHTTLPPKRWLAHPKTLRLSTRPKSLVAPSGQRFHSFNRTSRSVPLPNFIFNLKESINAIVEKLVKETLIAMFRKLHPYPSGWNLSLINIGVTNMREMASEDGSGGGGGRDIERMFRRQESVLRAWRVEDKDVPPEGMGDEEEEGSLGRLGGRDREEQDEGFLPVYAEEEKEDSMGKYELMNSMNDDETRNDYEIDTTRPTTKMTDPSAGNEVNHSPPPPPSPSHQNGSEDLPPSVLQTQSSIFEDGFWEEEEEEDNDDDEEDEDGSGRKGSLGSGSGMAMCREEGCGARMPAWAMEAHGRFHVYGG